MEHKKYVADVNKFSAQHLQIVSTNREGVIVQGHGTFEKALIELTDGYVMDNFPHLFHDAEQRGMNRVWNYVRKIMAQMSETELQTVFHKKNGICTEEINTFYEKYGLKEDNGSKTGPHRGLSPEAADALGMWLIEKADGYAAKAENCEAGDMVSRDMYFKALSNAYLAALTSLNVLEEGKHVPKMLEKWKMREEGIRCFSPTEAVEKMREYEQERNREDQSGRVKDMRVCGNCANVNTDKDKLPCCKCAHCYKGRFVQKKNA